MTQDLQGQHIKRMKRREPERYHTGFFHLCLIVDDVDAAAERIEEGGREADRPKVEHPPRQAVLSTVLSEPL